MDTNHPQTDHFWPSSDKYKGAGLFCDLFSLTSSFTGEVSSPHELDTDFWPPFVFTHSLSTFFYLLLTAVPSCHPSKLYLPSTLLYTRIITKRFYPIFRIHLGLSHIFLGLALRPLSSFQSVKLFFSLFFLSQPYFFLSSENHASGDDNRC